MNIVSEDAFKFLGGALKCDSVMDEVKLLDKAEVHEKTRKVGKKNHFKGRKPIPYAASKHMKIENNPANLAISADNSKKIKCRELDKHG
ncbi:hypothetical protein WA026_002044 [Henosepilachna vigintioctopunctata]|uniref:Uncharacterized protein n=1 Tax=Henosepilachna vigintioctopunctata TaxID=420089 RepID=A0AAW1UVI1_9CUCU